MTDDRHMNTEKKEISRKAGTASFRLRCLLYLLPVLLGVLFSLWYIRNAACDVVYSDYIRLIDSYLPEVTDPARFFVPDILTRIPAAFLQRLINVELFGFSVTFDRLCTVAGLFLCGIVLALYCAGQRIRPLIYLVIMAVLFSLIKWEILLNGSAWAHVVSFGLFFVNYWLLDRVYRGEGGPWHRAALYGLPFLILMFAGEYIASYTGGMILALSWCMLRQRMQSRETRAEAGGGGHESPRWGLLLCCSILPLILYLISRHFAVWEHAGATDMGFLEAMSLDPLFLPRFFIKSFAGAVLGQETIQSLTDQGLFSDGLVLALGALVILAYLLAMILYVRKRMYERTLFPMILLLTGGMNHVLVTASRWIFLRESYALSSRYAAQFMIGLMGILLIFGLALRREPEEAQEEGPAEAPEGRKPLSLPWKAGILFFCLLFLAGNCLTTRDELRKAPYRQENYEALSVIVRNYRDYDPEELCEKLEWGKSQEECLRALRILEENHLNVFREGS